MCEQSGHRGSERRVLQIRRGHCRLSSSAGRSFHFYGCLQHRQFRKSKPVRCCPIRSVIVTALLINVCDAAAFQVSSPAGMSWFIRSFQASRLCAGIRSLCRRCWSSQGARSHPRSSVCRDHRASLVCGRRCLCCGCQDLNLLHFACCHLVSL